MKNKRNIKILVPVVAVIWGLVLYKLIDAFYPEDPPIATSLNTTFELPKYQERDTFSLVPIEQDPFLGTLVRKKTARNIGTNLTKTTVAWPSTSYEGFVADDKGRTTVFVITVNGEQHLLKQGELVHDVQLIRGTKQSIQLQYKGQRKTFTLE